MEIKRSGSNMKQNYIIKNLILLIISFFIVSCVTQKQKESKYNEYLKNMESLDKVISQMDNYKKELNQSITKKNGKIDIELDEQHKVQMYEFDYNIDFAIQNAIQIQEYKKIVKKENDDKVIYKLHEIVLKIVELNFNEYSNKLKNISNNRPKLQELDKEAINLYTDILKEKELIDKISEYLFNKEYDNDSLGKGVELYDEYIRTVEKRQKSETIFKKLLKQKVF